jgi:hypothetical protein
MIKTPETREKRYWLLNFCLPEIIGSFCHLESVLNFGGGQFSPARMISFYLLMLVYFIDFYTNL